MKKLKIGFHVSREGRTFTESLSDAYEMLVNSLGTKDLIPCFQIFIAGPRSFKVIELSNDEIKGVNKLVKRTGMHIVAHGTYLDRPFDKSINSPEIVSIMKQNATLSRINNSYGPIIHMSKVSRRNGIGSLEELNSCNGPMILFETDASCDNGNIDDLIDSMNRLDNSLSSSWCHGIVLDTAHIYEAGIDLHDPKIMSDLLSRLPETIVAIHLNDSKTELGSCNDAHSHLGAKIFKGPGGIASLKKIISWAKNNDIMLIIENGPDDLNISLKLIAEILHNE